MQIAKTLCFGVLATSAKERKRVTNGLQVGGHSSIRNNRKNSGGGSCLAVVCVVFVVLIAITSVSILASTGSDVGSIGGTASSGHRCGCCSS